MKVILSWGPKRTNIKYRVAGADLERANQFLAEREEWGRFDGQFSYRWRGDARGNVLSVKLEPSFTITMPTWRGYRDQPQECKDEWDAMWRALRRHEGRHHNIFEQGLARLVGKLESLVGAKGTEVAALIKKENAIIQSDHNKFDRETDHGGSRGVELTITEKCKSKQASKEK